METGYANRKRCGSDNFLLLIFVMRLLPAKRIGPDALACFCCSGLGRYEDEWLLKAAVDLSILKSSWALFSYLRYMCIVGEVLNFSLSLLRICFDTNYVGDSGTVSCA